MRGKRANGKQEKRVKKSGRIPLTLRCSFSFPQIDFLASRKHFLEHSLLAFLLTVRLVAVHVAIVPRVRRLLEHCAIIALMLTHLQCCGTIGFSFGITGEDFDLQRRIVSTGKAFLRAFTHTGLIYCERHIIPKMIA